jgi:hypothetical protein
MCCRQELKRRGAEYYETYLKNQLVLSLELYRKSYVVYTCSEITNGTQMVPQEEWINVRLDTVGAG